MGPLTLLLGFPLTASLGGLGWIARQVAAAAEQQMLDPARIETALLRLERELEEGAIDEAGFEAAEAGLLRELADIRSILAERAATPEDGA